MTSADRLQMRDELRTAVAQFLTRAVPADSLRDLCRGEAFSTELWRQVAEMGWFRLLVPEDKGGVGLSLPDVGALFEEVGRQPLPGPLLEHVVVAPLLLSDAPAALRARLEEALDGNRILALADPLVDVVPDRREAQVSVADGRITGSVPYVRFGHLADDVVLFAESEQGPVVVLVPTDHGGVEIERSGGMDPTTRYATVVFRDVPVDDGVLVSAGEAAADLTGRIRSSLQLLMACELSGLTRRMFDMALEYAKVRHQFGRAIGSFQAVKHILADMFVRTYSLERLSAASLADIDEDADALALTAMVAKGYAAGISRNVGEAALQVHGGIGFTVEHDLHLYLKRALALQGPYGDQREIAVQLGHKLVMQGA